MFAPTGKAKRSGNPLGDVILNPLEPPAQLEKGSQAVVLKAFGSESQSFSRQWCPADDTRTPLISLGR